MEILEIIYIVQTLLILFLGVSWSLYLGCNVRFSQRFQRGASKSPDSTGLNSQIAYHYKTETVKYKILLCIVFSESLSGVFTILGYFVISNWSIENENFGRQLNQCLGSEMDLNSRNNFGIFTGSEFNQIPIILETIGTIFWLISQGCITSLIRILLHRKSKKSEFPRDAYLPLKLCILSSALLVLTILTEHTILLQDILAPISIFYINNLKYFKLLYQRLKRNTLDIQIDYGRNTTYFKHVRMIKYFKFIAILSNLFVFMLISACILDHTQKLASIFLYVGKCYFKLLYNINYTPFLQTEFQIRVLVKVNEVLDYFKLLALILPTMISVDLMSLIVILKLAYSFLHHRITGKLKVPIHYTGHRLS